MKKTAIILAFVLSIASLAFAAEKAAKPASAAKAVTYHGTVIDNLCATGNKANLGAFIKTHTAN
jgi:ABC-type glycerol-3-phosphate transport system substrate-binding protein